MTNGIGVLKRIVMSESDAAATLGISQRTLKNEVRRGKIPFILIGKRRKYDLNDIKNYIMEGRIQWPSEKKEGITTTTSRSKILDFAEARRRKPPPRLKR